VLQRGHLFLLIGHRRQPEYQYGQENHQQKADNLEDDKRYYAHVKIPQGHLMGAHPAEVENGKSHWWCEKGSLEGDRH